MSTAAFYFLFAMVAGQGDAASLTTLGHFADQQACLAARTSIEATLKGAESAARIFCVSSADLAPFGAAAKQSQ